MKNNPTFLALCIFFAFISFVHRTIAFPSTSNGVSVGGAGVFRIPVNAVLQRKYDGSTITDMPMYTSCSGVTGYNDALRNIIFTNAKRLQRKRYFREFSFTEKFFCCDVWYN